SRAGTRGPGAARSWTALRTSAARRRSGEVRRGSGLRLRAWTLRRCRSRRVSRTAAGDLRQERIERLVYPVPGHGGHRTRAVGGRTKVRLVRDDDDGDVREHPFDFLEETKLVDDRITACLGRIEEEEHAIRHMGQGRD